MEKEELKIEELTEWMDKLIRLKQEMYEAGEFSREIKTCEVRKEYDSITLHSGIELIADALGEEMEMHRNGDYIHCHIRYKGWTFAQCRRISPGEQDGV